MEFHEALSARLPAPRDDEPRGLRQDIVDELADHLACSANRELLRGADAATARARVLERFGDPAAVARRLWLDEMKGRIMAQRVVIATCVIVAVASVALVGLFWHQSIQAQRMAARQAAVAQAREQEMLKQLQDLALAVHRTRTTDLNPISFKLTEGEPNGPPVVTFRVWLGPLSERPNMDNFQDSGSSGVAELFPVPPGSYRFQIRRPWRDGEWVTNSAEKLVIAPGSHVVKHLVCPKVPPETAPVRIRYSLPEDLEKHGLTLFASFGQIRRALDDRIDWYLWDSRPVQIEEGASRTVTDDPTVFYPAIRRALCVPGSSAIGFVSGKSMYLWGEKNDDTDYARRNVSCDILEVDLRPSDASSPTLSWEVGKFQLMTLILMRPSHTADGDSDRRRYDPLASFSVLDGLGTYKFGFDDKLPRVPPSSRKLRDARDPPDDSGFGTPDDGVLGTPVAGFRTTKNFRDKIADRFEVCAGRVNEWNIPLPDELIKAVRMKLGSDATEQSK